MEEVNTADCASLNPNCCNLVNHTDTLSLAMQSTINSIRTQTSTNRLIVTRPAEVSESVSVLRKDECVCVQLALESEKKKQKK